MNMEAITSLMQQMLRQQEEAFNARFDQLERQERERRRVHEQRSRESVKLPSFIGRPDPEAYIEWEMKMEKFFSHHNYTDEKKVQTASLQFIHYALSWWHQEVSRRKMFGDQPIDTWEKMKRLMSMRYAPYRYRKGLRGTKESKSETKESKSETQERKEIIISSEQERNTLSENTECENIVLSASTDALPSRDESLLQEIDNVLPIEVVHEVPSLKKVKPISLVLSAPLYTQPTFGGPLEEYTENKVMLEKPSLGNKDLNSRSNSLQGRGNDEYLGGAINNGVFQEIDQLITRASSEKIKEERPSIEEHELKKPRLGVG